MKKRIATLAMAAIMAVAPFGVSSVAEGIMNGLAESHAAVPQETIDGMSYNALVVLRTRVNAALAKKATWKDIEVPQGVWIVGEDIPAGKWTVECKKDNSYTTISWGDVLKDNGEEIDLWNAKRYSVNNHVGTSIFADMEVYTFEAREGEYIIVEDGIALFSQYTGKPSLGFWTTNSTEE